MKSFSRQLARLSADHQRIAKGAARVALFLLLGKFAGAFKEMAVAWRYGVSDVVDAYQFTFTLASWLPVTLAGVLSVVLIPVLVRSRKRGDEARQRFLSELLGWTMAAGVVLAVAIYVAWPWVLAVAGQGLSAETRAISMQLTWAFAPAALLTLLSGMSAARLRAHERHLNTLLDSVPAVVILIWVLLHHRRGSGHGRSGGLHDNFFVFGHNVARPVLGKERGFFCGSGGVAGLGLV